MSALDEPANLSRRIGVQLGFDQIEINPQLSVEFRTEPMLDNFVGNPCEDGENDCRRNSVPQRQAKLQRTALPPVLHARLSSRSTNPTPRTVWMSFTRW